MQLFYCNSISGNKALLNEDETKHCKVLRKKVGDEIHVLDGCGNLAYCRIEDLTSAGCALNVLELIAMPSPRTYYFHLLIAPTKQNERTEWMFEKAIEAGLDEITFIETENSEKSKINRRRLDKIAISAIKQSKQYTLPKINPLIKLKDLEVDESFFAAFCGNATEKVKIKDIQTKLKPGNSISILIGPEGDFTEDEVENLLNKGAKVLDLGQTRLRTETAGVYCAAVLNALF